MTHGKTVCLKGDEEHCYFLELEILQKKRNYFSVGPYPCCLGLLCSHSVYTCRRPMQSRDLSTLLGKGKPGEGKRKLRKRQGETRGREAAT